MNCYDLRTRGKCMNYWYTIGLSSENGRGLELGCLPNFGLRGVPGLCVRTLFHNFKDDRLMNMFDKQNHDFYFDLEKYIADT